MKLIKADNAPGFARDPTNSAVLATDLPALEAYRNKRKRNLNIDNALQDINTLKQEMSEIKDMITQLLAKKDE